MNKNAWQQMLVDPQAFRAPLSRRAVLGGVPQLPGRRMARYRDQVG
jgi:hypothetical protein